MRRFILLAITCIVVDQLKSQTGWLTKCKGIDEDGQVIFNKKIAHGQEVSYKPYIVAEDDFIHGQILGIADAPPDKPKVMESSDTGKSVDPK